MKQIKTPKYRLSQNGFLRTGWQYEDDAIVYCPHGANGRCGIHCPMFGLYQHLNGGHAVTLHCCNRVLDVEVE